MLAKSIYTYLNEHDADLLINVQAGFQIGKKMKEK